MGLIVNKTCQDCCIQNVTILLYVGINYSHSCFFIAWCIFISQAYRGTNLLLRIIYIKIPYSVFLLSGLSVQKIMSELKNITNPVEEKLVSVIYNIILEFCSLTLILVNVI